MAKQTYCDLYKFSKKRNSTLQPTDATAFRWHFDNIKITGGSIINPVLSFHDSYLSTGNVITECNYCYLDGEFQRYYYITNWSYNPPYWTASLLVDVLATYKQDIGSSIQLVLRAASEFDTNIVDNNRTVKVSYTSENIQLKNFSWKDDTYVVVYTLNASYEQNLQEVTSSKLILTTTSGFARMCAELFEKVTGYVNDYPTAINPLSYITSAFLIPSKCINKVANENSGGTRWIYVGGKGEGNQVNFFGDILSEDERVQHLKEDVEHKVHPQATEARWLNFSPYTTISCYLPAFGNFDIKAPLNLVDGVEKLQYTVICDIDLRTGGALLKFQDINTYQCLACASAKIATDIPLTGMTLYQGDYTSHVLSSLANSTSSAGQTGATFPFMLNNAYQLKSSASQIGSVLGAGLAAAAPGMTMLGGIYAVVSAVETSLASAASYRETHRPTASVLNMGGCLVGNASNSVSTAIYSYVADTNINTCGRPLYKNKKISDLSGFIQCANTSLALTGLKQGGSHALNDETQNVIDFMNGGFYYE